MTVKTKSGLAFELLPSSNKEILKFDNIFRKS